MGTFFVLKKNNFKNISNIFKNT